jgi:hypothetical protein
MAGQYDIFISGEARAARDLVARLSRNTAAGALVNSVAA